MVKIFVYIAICGVLFAAGLGLALALDLPSQLASQSPVEAAGLEPQISDVVPSNPEAELTKLDTDEPPAQSPQLPVAVRGRPLSAEELFRFGAMYREQQDALNRRSEEIELRNARLKIIRDDLAGSRKEYDGLRAQVRDMMQQVEQSLFEYRQSQQFDEPGVAPDQPQQDTAATPKPTSQSSNRANAKKIAAWMESMPAEKAAEYLRELSNEGKVDSAVELLASIEERNVAKILAAMESPALVVELTEAFRTAKKIDDRPGRMRR